MKKKPLILIGAGGHAKSCIDIIENQNKYHIFGIIDKSNKKNFMGYKVLGNDKKLEFYSKKIKDIVIAIGQIKNFEKRFEIFKKCKTLGFRLPIIKSKNSYISKNVIIGEGTLIFHNVIINSQAKIGKNCIINTRSLIEHDVEIGNNCHISTGSILNGSAKVGDNSFIGSGTVVSHSVKIKAKSFIKFGSRIF